MTVSEDQQRRRFTPPSRPAIVTAAQLPEVLAALSRALDLTEGQPEGHSVRACAIGMRLGAELGLPSSDLEALYYALLLKDAGCSSNAARMSALFGASDQHVKGRMKVVDWHRRVRLAVATFRLAGHGGSALDHLRQFLVIARTADMTREIIAVRCERGAEIARMLGFPDATADAIRSLDEHWNGAGHPSGLEGEEIPMLSRIANLAQVLEVFHREQGRERALDVARARSGRWFDPRLVRIAAGWRKDERWWGRLADEDLEARVVSDAPFHAPRRPVADLDVIARAFAEIIDAKSPFTYRHSSNVSRYAVELGGRLGLDGQLLSLRRAGLLHDIGKLGVSSRILDKPGRLTEGERGEVEAHPRFTWAILSRIGAFGDFAWMAAVHHEKLDGTGYPWRLTASELDPPSRVLAVADIYEALTADRPYRSGLAPAVALGIILKERGTKLCARTVDALAAMVAELPAGGVGAIAGP